MTGDDTPSTITRRAVIASTALVPVAAIQSAAQPAGPAFSASERRILEAFLDRLIPKDDNGPGAVECGVADYIERSLTGPLAAEKAGILDGLAATDALARKVHGAGFAELAPGKQDAVLKAMESSAAGFFDHIRRLTLEGMFGDPYYGGNRGFAGWDLIRYPGVRLAVSPQEQKMAPVKPAHTSAWGSNHGH
jgi:gluconate 2-dehydrogenase gamma chain